MTTLDEAIAPDSFEVVSTFPVGNRDRVTTAERALKIALSWCGPRIPCVQITAYGTTGPPDDHGFALRNLEYIAAERRVDDSGWRCWLGAGQFIGEVV